MKSKTNKAAPSEPKHTPDTDNTCIFTTADRKRLKKLLSKELFDKLMTLKEGDEMPWELIDSDGDEIDRKSMDQISINYWHDGNEEHIYQIGKNVYAYLENSGEFIVYVENSVYAVLDYNYSYKEGICEEKCVHFQIKPRLQPAERGGYDLCRVWINTFYVDDHIRAGDHSGWARGEDREIIWFDSYSVARKWINQDQKEHHDYRDIQYPNGHYLYNHNEYAPRKYKICK